VNVSSPSRPSTVSTSLNVIVEPTVIVPPFRESITTVFEALLPSSVSAEPPPAMSVTFPALSRRKVSAAEPPVRLSTPLNESTRSVELELRRSTPWPAPSTA